MHTKHSQSGESYSQLQARLPVTIWHLGKNVDLSNVQNETSHNDSEWWFIII